MVQAVQGVGNVGPILCYLVPILVHSLKTNQCINQGSSFASPLEEHPFTFVRRSVTAHGIHSWYPVTCVENDVLSA